MPTDRFKPQYRRPPPRYIHEEILQRPVLPPPNQLSARPMIPVCPTILTLPIPSPHLYRDNYHHPSYPFLLAPLNRIVTPETYPLRFPHPLGPLPAHTYDLLGVRLHDMAYVDRHPEKRFTKWLLWYLEVNDFLLRSICPSDLNNVPCEWDELQGGCGMLRLCDQKAEWAHPHLGYLSERCDGERSVLQKNSSDVLEGREHKEDMICASKRRNNCLYIHDIEPTCRGITKELHRPIDPSEQTFEDIGVVKVHDARIPTYNKRQERQFCSYQQCPQIAVDEVCWWGHDLESARIAAVFRYFNHRAEARQYGSTGVIKTDRTGMKAWKVIRPSLEALKEKQTFHGCCVED